MQRAPRRQEAAAAEREPDSGGGGDGGDGVGAGAGFAPRGAGSEADDELQRASRARARSRRKVEAERRRLGAVGITGSRRGSNARPLTSPLVGLVMALALAAALGALPPVAAREGLMRIPSDPWGTSSSWTKAEPLQASAREALCATGLNGTLYVLGGQNTKTPSELLY